MLGNVINNIYIEIPKRNNIGCMIVRKKWLLLFN